MIIACRERVKSPIGSQVIASCWCYRQFSTNVSQLNLVHAQGHRFDILIIVKLFKERYF